MDESKLRTANEIIATFAPHVTLTWDRGFWLSWTPDYGDRKPKRLKWVAQSRGSDFPRGGSRRFPFGGTCCCAVMEVVRWLRGDPVRPLCTWKYWCSKTVGMNPRALELVTAAGWPADVPCVLCGRLLTPADSWDHYDRDGFPVGPGCVYGDANGCHGKGAAAP